MRLQDKPIDPQEFFPQVDFIEDGTQPVPDDFGAQGQADDRPISFEESVCRNHITALKKLWRQEHTILAYLSDQVITLEKEGTFATVITEFNDQVNEHRVLLQACQGMLDEKCRQLESFRGNLCTEAVADDQGDYGYQAAMEEPVVSDQGGFACEIASEDPINAPFINPCFDIPDLNEGECELPETVFGSTPSADPAIPAALEECQPNTFRQVVPNEDGSGVVVYEGVAPNVQQEIGPQGNVIYA